MSIPPAVGTSDSNRPEWIWTFLMRAAGARPPGEEAEIPRLVVGSSEFVAKL